MMLIVGGEEEITVSVHYDKGKLPALNFSNKKEEDGRVCQKELIIGNLTIHIFERET